MDSMLEQIEVMSEVASTFSTFATMPLQVDEKINIIEVVKSSINMFEENYIFLSYDFDYLEIIADKNQIIRVFNNLIKNAIQALENTENPEINIEIKKNNKIITVKIRDNGCGIKAENLALVFEPKFTTKSSGMGLGLVMVKNIIENLKGQIAIQSEENQGTTFTITFPIHKNIDQSA